MSKGMFLFYCLGSIIYLLVTCSGCGLLVDDSVAIRAVESMGFKNPQITNKAIFFLGLRGCSKEDDVKFDIRAKNNDDQNVYLTVCAGYFKDATIRVK